MDQDLQRIRPDKLTADLAVAHLLLAEIVVEIALGKPVPDDWAKRLFSRLYDRLDISESRPCQRPDDIPEYSLAKQRLGTLARHVQALIQQHSEHPSDGARQRAP